MRLWLIIFPIVLLSAGARAEVIINEIMYNPSQCSDSVCEWIELHNEGNGAINLTGWALCGTALLAGAVNNSNGSLHRDSGMSIPAKGFALVTDGGTGTQVYENFSVDAGAVALHVDASSICGELGNSGGTLNLSNGSYQYIITYGNDKANGNGKTWEWSGSHLGESLIVGGTPGRTNSIAGLSNDIRALRINEFLPDPIGNDDAPLPQGEFVELQNMGSVAIDARGLVLYDSNDDNEVFVSDTTTIGGTTVPAGGFLVVYRAGDSDFALNNDGFDEVRLFNGSSQGLLIDRVSYSGSAEGMSWSNLSGMLKKVVPTPGSANVDKGNCDWSIAVRPKTSVFSSGKDVSWDVVVQKKYGLSTTLSVRGSLEDVFGRVVDSYAPLTNESVASTRTVGFTPNVDKDVFIIRFRIEQLGCSDDDVRDNSDDELVVVNPQHKNEEAFLDIRDVLDLGSDGVAEWGDIIRVKVMIYKGNTSKQNVELSVEDKEGKQVGKATKVSAFDEFTNITTTLPVELVNNCDKKLSDGRYTLVLEGLDKTDEADVRIEGYDKGACDDEKGQTQGSTSSFALNEFPNVVSPGERFDITLNVVGDQEERDVTVWAYVFRGSKSYSGEREGNKKEVHVGKGEEKRVTLPLHLDDDVEVGEYKLKVKLNKKGQKTNKEITETIAVAEGLGQIADFYADEKYDGNNTALVVKAGGGGGTVGLLSFFGEQARPLDGGAAQFNVSLIEGDNIFFAKLLGDEGEIVDVSQLTLKVQGNEVREIMQRVELSAESEDFLRERLKAVREETRKPGIVIYESSSWKARELAPWFFVGALVALVGVLVFKKV